MKPQEEVHQRFHRRKAYRKSRWCRSRKRLIRRMGCDWTEKIGPFPVTKEEIE